MLYIVEGPRECIPFALTEEIEGRHYTRYNEDGTEGEVSQVNHQNTRRLGLTCENFIG